MVTFYEDPELRKKKESPNRVDALTWGIGYIGNVRELRVSII